MCQTEGLFSTLVTMLEYAMTFQDSGQKGKVTPKAHIQEQAPQILLQIFPRHIPPSPSIQQPHCYPVLMAFSITLFILEIMKRPHLCAGNILIIDGSEQQDAHLLSPGVLAPGISMEILEHNGKQRKSISISFCIIPASFLISLQLDNFMQYGVGRNSVILKVVHWGHHTCACL